MTTIETTCGRYSINKASEEATHVEIVEYDGVGPRMIVSRISVPVELINMFLTHTQKIEVL